jgi:predicted nuclease of predicted toxin-antitoxin system
VLHGQPWKLLLIRTGNLRTRELKGLFEQHLPTIVAALEHNSLVELDCKTVRVVR